MFPVEMAEVPMDMVTLSSIVMTPALVDMVRVPAGIGGASVQISSAAKHHITSSPLDMEGVWLVMEMSGTTSLETSVSPPMEVSVTWIIYF